MEIIVGKTAGFCFGVANAINKTEKFLNKYENLYCLGELVHNKQVIEDLEKKGLKFIDNIKQAKDNLIIRAHGEPKETYQKAIELGINTLDLTCPRVLKIHSIATEYLKNGYYIFLIGQKEHPETIGTISYCGENSSIIQTEEDIQNAFSKLYKSNINKVLVLSQTTYSMEKFNEIVELIERNLEDKNIELEIKNTICNATKLRQEETEKIAKTVDLMIIIGGKNSSNTNKLYGISSNYCENCILIETKNEIEKEYVKKFEKIGIMAGASTPQKSINSVVEMLEEIC